MRFMDLFKRMIMPFWVEYENRMAQLIDAKMQIGQASADAGPGASMQLKDPGHRWQLLQIGLTDACNLLCLHCTRTPSQLKGFKGHMTLPVFSRYLDCFHPDWFDKLLLSDWGEPTIIKGLLNYLYLARRKGWHNVEMFTNATSTDMVLVEEIVCQMLLKRIFVSLEAASPDLYERIRKSDHKRFMDFMNGLSGFIAHYRSDMHICFNVVCMKTNLHELPKIVRLAQRFDVSIVHFVHLNTITTRTAREKLCNMDEHLDSLDRAEVCRVFEEVVQLADEAGIEYQLPEDFPEITGAKPMALREQSEFLCREPQRWVRVSLDGGIHPCCQSGTSPPMGNINNLDFYSIWNNLKYKRLLDGIRPGGEPDEICSQCNMLAGKNF